eukprot:g37159.t1
MRNFFSHRMVNLWNLLPHKAVEAKSLSVFCDRVINILVPSKITPHPFIKSAKPVSILRDLINDMMEIKLKRQEEQQRDLDQDDEENSDMPQLDRGLDDILVLKGMLLTELHFIPPRPIGLIL